MDEGGLSIPDAGTLRVPVKAGEEVRCGFSPESAVMEIQGDDLTFTSEQGGVLVLVGFVPALEQGEVLLEFPDFAVSGKELYAATMPDFSTDFGETPKAFAETSAAEESELPLVPGLSFALLESEPQSVSDLLDHGRGPGGDMLLDPAYVAAGSASHRFFDDPFVISVTQISQDAVDDAVPTYLRLDVLL